MITVVCSIADREIYNKCLGKSLSEQIGSFGFLEAPINLPIVPSYNSVIDKVYTKYIAFIHQDIIMMEPTWLKKLESYCDNIPDLGVAGVAGKSWGGKCVGHILHMGHPSYKSSYYGKIYNALYYGDTVNGIPRPMNGPELAQTIDTLAIIIPTDIFKRIRFDENLNQEFSVDYCLAVKWKLNLNTYVLPLRTWHAPFTTVLGTVAVSKDYEKRAQFHTQEGLQKAHEYIKNKWKGKFNLIFATCDIDGCPRCKTNPCICTKPLTMEESFGWGK